MHSIVGHMTIRILQTNNLNKTSVSVKLTQTRHSHSKLLFHGAQISQGFYREGQKVKTCTLNSQTNPHKFSYILQPN